MGGIVFPDVARTLGPLIQMDRAAEESRLNRERLDRHDQMIMQDRQQQRSLQLDAAQRAKLKDAADATTQAAMGVLNAPEAERPAAYTQALAFLKARGHDTANLPPAYSPGMDGMLRFYIQKAETATEFLKRQSEMPQPMGLPGAPAAAPTAAPANREQFISMMTPHALQVAQATGLDPRLVLAQAALETGFGTAAPGNNYFGIKSHGQPGGQTLATNEAGPGGMVPTQASFRTYADPGASARDYGDFLKTNPRYASVLDAQGLDAQIDAMGRSGYATDPQYGAKLRAIAQSLPQIGPTMGTPPAQFAQAGANAAPMPNVSPQQVGALPGNPVAMPGVPAGIIPQGDAVTGQGDVRTPPGAAPDEVLTLRAYVNSRIPGAQVLGVRGEAVYDKGGRVRILLPNGQTDSIDPPPKPQAAPAGYRYKPGGELEPIPGGPVGVAAAENKAKNEQAATKQSTEQANKLRDDFRTEPDVKRYRVVVPMLESAKDAASRPTRAADLNLIYAFAKLMDPESVVRESETGMVVASGTVADRLAGYVGQLNGGQMLQPETRTRLIAELESRFRSLDASYQEIANAYGEIADANGIKRSHVILPIRKPKEPETTPGDAGGGAPKVRTFNHATGKLE